MAVNFLITNTNPKLYSQADLQEIRSHLEAFVDEKYPEEFDVIELSSSQMNLVSNSHPVDLDLNHQTILQISRHLQQLRQYKRLP